MPAKKATLCVRTTLRNTRALCGRDEVGEFLIPGSSMNYDKDNARICPKCLKALEDWLKYFGVSGDL